MNPPTRATACCAPAFNTRSLACSSSSPRCSSAARCTCGEARPSPPTPRSVGPAALVGARAPFHPAVAPADEVLGVVGLQPEGGAAAGIDLVLRLQPVDLAVELAAVVPVG